MGKTSHLQIEERLEKAEAVYQRTLEDLGDEYRREVLLPICLDTGFSFCVYNGDWWFQNGEREVRDDQDADEQEAPYLKPYIATLDLPDALGGVFAHYVTVIRVPIPVAEKPRLQRTTVSGEVDVQGGVEIIGRDVPKTSKRKGKKV